MGADTIGPWGRDRAADLLRLTRRCLPDETLSIDDLESVCFAAPSPHPDLLRHSGSVVLGTTDGHGALALSSAELGEHRSAHVQLLLVDPSRRGRGTARSLLDAAGQWAVDAGIDELHLGGGAPYYLFTGIDSRWTDALCAAEACGFERIATELDLSCPTRAAHPAVGVSVPSVRGVRSDEDLEDLLAFCARHWPLWTAELRRAGESGTATIARDGDGVIKGAAAHSVSRLGVIGPVAVDPSSQRGGVGAALMSHVLAELSVAGLARAEIAWTSTVRFYARAAGASVARSSIIMRRRLVA